MQKQQRTWRANLIQSHMHIFCNLGNLKILLKMWYTIHIAYCIQVMWEYDWFVICSRGTKEIIMNKNLLGAFVLAGTLLVGGVANAANWNGLANYPEVPNSANGT